jgi:hypothetical protein
MAQRDEHGSDDNVEPSGQSEGLGEQVTWTDPGIDLGAAQPPGHARQRADRYGTSGEWRDQLDASTIREQYGNQWQRDGKQTERQKATAGVGSLRVTKEPPPDQAKQAGAGKKAAGQHLRAVEQLRR